MPRKPGYYILEENVLNPKPDRRSKEWRLRPMWTAGTRVRVEEVNIGDRDNPRHVLYYLPVNESLSSYGISQTRDPERYEALDNAAMAERRPTMSERFWKLNLLDGEALEVLEILGVTDEQLAAAAEEIQSRYDVTPADGS